MAFLLSSVMYTGIAVFLVIYTVWTFVEIVVLWLAIVAATSFFPR